MPIPTKRRAYLLRENKGEYNAGEERCQEQKRLAGLESEEEKSKGVELVAAHYLIILFSSSIFLEASLG